MLWASLWLNSLAFIFFRLQLLASPWLRGIREELGGAIMRTMGGVHQGVHELRMVGLDKRWHTIIQDVVIY